MFEARRNDKGERRILLCRIINLGIRYSFGIRHSCFVISIDGFCLFSNACECVTVRGFMSMFDKLERRIGFIECLVQALQHRASLPYAALRHAEGR